jgi:hypothetical protein
MKKKKKKTGKRENFGGWKFIHNILRAHVQTAKPDTNSKLRVIQFACPT